MPPRTRYKSTTGRGRTSVGASRPSTPKKGKGPSRSAQRSQTSRTSQKRQQEQKQREERADVREQARQPDRPQPSQRQPGLAASIPAKTMSPALKANRLEKEFKTANDDRKKQIVSELKDTRSELNRLNKEQSFLDLRRAAAGAGVPGLVARTSDGSIITDSSGNPIMTGRGFDVFQQGRQEFVDDDRFQGGRQKFIKESGRLFEESPELYKRMYPITYGMQTMIPKIIESAPGLGALGRIARSVFGKTKDVGPGIMKTKVGGDFKTMLGDLFGGFGNLVPGGRGEFAGGGGRVQEGGDGGGAGIPSLVEDPSAGPGDIWTEPFDPTQGVIGGMPEMYQPGYGGSIGQENQMRTADWIDTDSDQIDDRDQAGPGQPHWQRSAEQGQKFATPGLPQAPSALTPGSALAMSPITQQLQFQQPNANWQQWNQNLRRFS